MTPFAWFVLVLWLASSSMVFIGILTSYTSSDAFDRDPLHVEIAGAAIVVVLSVIGGLTYPVWGAPYFCVSKLVWGKK